MLFLESSYSVAVYVIKSVIEFSNNCKYLFSIWMIKKKV